MSSLVVDFFPSHAIFDLLIAFQSYHRNYLFRRFGEYLIAAAVGFCFSSFPDFDARFSILKRKKGGFAGDISTGDRVRIPPLASLSLFTYALLSRSAEQDASARY
jgi:hypothetical protein